MWYKKTQKFSLFKKIDYIKIKNICLAKNKTKQQNITLYDKSLTINDTVGENIDTFLTNEKISQINK